MESAGAIVVPIHWDSTYDEIDFLLARVNGILFTGGATELNVNVSSPGYTYNKFLDTAAFIFEKAL